MTQTPQGKPLARANGAQEPPPQDDPINLAPHSIEAEEAVLGSVLMDGRWMKTLRTFLNAEDFFIVRHGWIYAAMLRLFERDAPIDTRTLAEELRVAGRLADVGGEAYLNWLPTSTPTAMHCEIYGRIVERSSYRRWLIGYAGQVAQLAHNEERDIHDVVNAINDLWRDARARLDVDGMTPIYDAANIMYEEAMEGGAHMIPSTYVDLDELLSGGFSPKRTYYIAAESGMGKTTFMVSLARNIAYRMRLRGRRVMVLLFSMEMTKEEVTAWMTAGGMKYPASNFWKMPKESPEIQAKFREWTGWTADLPIMIVDDSTTTPAQMQKYIEDLQRDGWEVIWFVDHIQRAATGIDKLDNSDKEYARVSLLAQRYKNIAKDTNTPGVILTQLNRSMAGRNDKRPTPNDIRGSGRIREEADVVLGMYREYDEDKSEIENMVTEFIPLKNRQGPTDHKVYLPVKLAHTRFYNMLWRGDEPAGIDWRLEEELDQMGAGERPGPRPVDFSQF